MGLKGRELGFEVGFLVDGADLKALGLRPQGCSTRRCISRWRRESTAHFGVPEGAEGGNGAVGGPHDGGASVDLRGELEAQHGADGGAHVKGRLRSNSNQQSGKIWCSRCCLRHMLWR